jgi:hypothetical protein
MASWQVAGLPAHQLSLAVLVAVHGRPRLPAIGLDQGGSDPGLAAASSRHSEWTFGGSAGSDLPVRPGLVGVGGASRLRTWRRCGRQCRAELTEELGREPDELIPIGTVTPNSGLLACKVKLTT